ncbi:fructose bisphosphate aldolase [Vagococcus carniphilus]|uniref:fructose bisphosphate aldolase n=1 Tax=Vagococcus carniphilus TaxID=218144 RepID=UPI00288F6A6C|nr:fructose bisphosphate aldolase [Vagococcus carniphilus]MDT2831969.1 fructose bisphosphate aldolase [Vagococcus carniphilus]MDT2840815.1 fructose bisphosphate aldolase [Vagococcus carniphilus]MDT2855479.1 fructose bisphosphate aldolase [Vagococcus carniphilus]
MNEQQLTRMTSGKGFIAALDQSGGSTPKALKAYGIEETSYDTDEAMFDLVHEMRSRIIKSPAFNSEHILGAILFEGTMLREIDGVPTADYLWNKKGILSFLKIDKGLCEEENGVQLMKPIPNLSEMLEEANRHHIFGTKERSLIKLANPKGIKEVVAQQFELGKQVAAAGLVPIIEPEIDIFSPEKEEAEKMMKEEIIKQLAALEPHVKVMLKLSIPTIDNYYEDLANDPHVVRIVALSGGYSRKDANEKLARNHQLIASFSRALAEGLTHQQTAEEFDHTLEESISAIYKASIS